MVSAKPRRSSAHREDCREGFPKIPSKFRSASFSSMYSSFVVLKQLILRHSGVRESGQTALAGAKPQRSSSHREDCRELLIVLERIPCFFFPSRDSLQRMRGKKLLLLLVKRLRRVTMEEAARCGAAVDPAIRTSCARTTAPKDSSCAAALKFSWNHAATFKSTSR